MLGGSNDLPLSMQMPTPLSIRPVGRTTRPRSCVFCATVCNCAPTLKFVLESMATAQGAVFDTVAFIISHDHCTDGSVAILEQFQTEHDFEVVIIENIGNDSPHRTHRIAHARNAIMECMEQHFASRFDYFAVFDADDVCCRPLRLDVLERYLDDAYADAWDALTFDPGAHTIGYPLRYYDLWGLQFGFFVHNVFGWGEHSRLLGQLMHETLIRILDEAPPGSLLPCRSAFAGFGLYRTSKFRGVRYDASIIRTAPATELAALQKLFEGLLGTPLTLEQIRPNENCEHIAFHVGATAKHGAKIVLANETLFRARDDAPVASQSLLLPAVEQPPRDWDCVTRAWTREKVTAALGLPPSDKDPAAALASASKLQHQWASSGS